MKLTPRRYGATPPAGGLQAVVQRGRDLRRRRTMLGTGASGAFVAVAVAAVLAVTGSSTNQSLEYADPSATASADATTEPSSSPSGAATESTPTPDSGDCDDDSECLEGEEADCVNNDCYEIEESPNPAATRPSYTENPTMSLETKTTCLASGQAVSREATCVMYDGEREVTVSRSSTISIAMRLCVASNASGPVTYHFPGGGEHDVRVTGDYGMVWSFAESVQFTGGPHDVQLLPRQCRGYTTTLDTRDLGHDVPAGEYQVNLRSLASTRNGQDWPESSKGLPFFTLHLTD